MLTAHVEPVGIGDVLSSVSRLPIFLSETDIPPRRGDYQERPGLSFCVWAHRAGRNEPGRGPATDSPPLRPGGPAPGVPRIRRVRGSPIPAGGPPEPPPVGRTRAGASSQRPGKTALRRIPSAGGRTRSKRPPRFAYQSTCRRAPPDDILAHAVTAIDMKFPAQVKLTLLEATSATISGAPSM